MLRAKQVDGIIAFPTGGNVELFQKMLNDNYPVVFMDRIIPGLSVNTVLLDNEKASFLAVDHFVSKGHEKIGLFAPPLRDKLTPRLERINAYKKALQSHHIPFRPDYLVSRDIDNMQEEVSNMMEMSDPPTALLALNDRVLFEVLTYTKEQQISIPEDVALIGIDDVPFAGFYRPALTTVAQPAFDMGKKAAELLLNQIRNKASDSGKEIYRFEPQLIIRESCEAKDN